MMQHAVSDASQLLLRLDRTQLHTHTHIYTHTHAHTNTHMHLNNLVL